MHDKLYIAHVSVHGRIRGLDPELGADPDTGGQTRYVLDLLRALGGTSDIERVDLLTRLIEDETLSTDYSVEQEELSPGRRIVRLLCGPKKYVAKEQLWPFLPEFVDNAIDFFRRQSRLPDILHGHYADAGLVVSRLSKVLGIPFLFTAHSLGRYKRDRLIAGGADIQKLEERFHFIERIEAEEEALENAAGIVASTSHEIKSQYSAYDHFVPSSMKVMRPGCDLAGMNLRPSKLSQLRLEETLAPFLRQPKRPPIVAIARPDKQKNLEGLIEAFGLSSLREKANLILLVGSREDIGTMESETGAVYARVLALIDRFDLYGYVAYPKRHERGDVETLLNFTRLRRGVLANVSAHENLGLTLIEAAAAGVPVVSSGAGGMTEVIMACKHGLIADGNSPTDIAEKLDKLLTSQKLWRRLSRNGRERSLFAFSWAAFTDDYLRAARDIVTRRLKALPTHALASFAARRYQKVFLCDIDDTLLGDRAALLRLSAILSRHPEIAFGVATGRSLEGAVKVLSGWGLPAPDILVTSVGSRIHYNLDGLHEDHAWTQHIRHAWSPQTIRTLLKSRSWLKLQEDAAQGPEKISYYIIKQHKDPVGELKSLLRRHFVKARVIVSRNGCLDILPTRCSKGHALRYLSLRLGIDVKRFITAGDSGNDLDMLAGSMKGIVVANHMKELKVLQSQPGVYFSRHTATAGVVDGLKHFGIL